MFLNIANLKVNNKIEFILLILLVCIMYGYIYWIFGTCEHFNFVVNNTIENSSKQYLTFLDALYFAFNTHTTIGYGDITPKSQLLRFISITHTILIIVLLVYSNLGQ
jgi:hypothetical protein